jgi:ABC-type multidrug transport system fused ATPase/permease subunit
MPASTSAPPCAAAAEEGTLAFFLRPLLLHGAGAVAHLLLALAVAAHLVVRRCGLSAVGRATKGGGAFRCYGVAACATWALATLSAAYACYLCLGGGDGWSRDAVAGLADAAARAAGWLLLAAYLQFEFGRRRQEELFPAPLRLWWALFLLLSVLLISAHVATRLDGVPVPALSWALDAVSVVGAVVLLSAGFLGRSEGLGGPASEEEPLLNGGAHDAANDNTRSSAEESLFTGAGFLSALSFSWMGPLLAVGNKKTLGLEDVPGLDPGDSVASLLPTFTANHDSLRAASASGQKPVTAFTLTKALLCTVRWHVAVTAFYALVYNVATYVGPYLIDALVQYLNGGDERRATNGQLLVVAFVVAKALECVSQRHWFFRLQQAGIRARSALVSVVYHKGLALSSPARQSRTSGEMINIISVDADRVGIFAWYMHDLWLMPLQVGMALFILYSTLGLAALAALGATVVVMLANVPPGQMQEKFQQKLMDCKDVRMKATSEILRNMRILKLQGWEMKFLSKIIDLRKTETKWLKKYLYTSTMVTFVFWGAPTFVAVVTFGACMLMGIPLESGKVLSALATFRVLQEPIYNLPDTISMVIQTKVSLDRIASFLCLEELPTDAVQRLPSGSSDIAIEVTNGNFSWEASPEALTLKDLYFQARKGMRIAVCGTVGSGKSSLLSCILGEIPKVSGEVKTCGTTAYVSQSAWIQSGKIQDNILFGKEMDSEKYERVLQSCSLNKDMEILPFGDQTVIGERGINLSGGQKQRIQIARALYQEADIYLFDDPFSAVDAHTGSHLFKVHDLP